MSTFQLIMHRLRHPATHRITAAQIIKRHRAKQRREAFADAWRHVASSARKVVAVGVLVGAVAITASGVTSLYYRQQVADALALVEYHANKRPTVSVQGDRRELPKSMRAMAAALENVKE